jgi:hypothetical protein
MGSSNKATPPTVTTQSNEPWGPAQGPIASALSSAQSLYNADVGYKPYTGALQAAVDPRTTEALAMTENTARNGYNIAPQAYQTASGILGNMGMSAQAQPGLDSLAATARGDSLGVVNPALQSMLDTNSENAMNRVNSISAGMGRYGSASHGAAAGRAITEATAPLLAQNYEAERGRQLAASQGMVDNYGAGMDRALRTAASGSAIQDLQYDPARRLAGVGDFYTGRNEDLLAQQRDLYDQAQARPWEQVARLNAIASGAGQLGGTQVSTTPRQSSSTAQRAIGGAAAGAAAGSMFGPWGTALGGAGGGLLGLFG